MTKIGRGAIGANLVIMKGGGGATHPAGVNLADLITVPSLTRLEQVVSSFLLQELLAVTFKQRGSSCSACWGSSWITWVGELR